MNDYIRFADGSTLSIEGGASLSRIIHIAQDEAAAVAACALVTPANLQRVEVCTDGVTYGAYEGLVKDAEPFRYTNEDETVTVVISLREQSEVELRVRVLEEEMLEVQEALVEV